jgi:hypothetical protein
MVLTRFAVGPGNILGSRSLMKVTLAGGDHHDAAR